MSDLWRAASVWCFWIGLASSTMLVGCAKSSSVVCDDGRLCPTGTLCEMVAATPICATKEQVAQCKGQDEAAPCQFAMPGDGACHDGVCEPVACGNGLLDPGEKCDDNNNTGGDLCSADCQSDETCGNGILDPVRLDKNGVAQVNETCDDGNLVSHDGCSSRCQPEALAWNDISLQHVPERAGAALAFDSVRQRFVLFGGYSENAVQYDDTWESADGIAWRQLPTPYGPSRRDSAGMAYDPVRRRMVLFGGSTSGLVLADTWEWDGEHWQDVTPATGGPSARAGFAIAYDPSRKAVVVFGGIGAEGDTWAWNGATWTRLPDGPPPRSGASMAYDPMRGALVMSPGSSANADTWELDAMGWHLRETGAGSVKLKDTAILAFDAGRQQVVAVLNSFSYNGALFGWNGATWQDIASNTPRRGGGALASDPAHATIVMVDYFPNYPQIEAESWRFHSGAWTLDPPPTQSTFGTPRASAYETQSRTEVIVTDTNTVELTGDAWSVNAFPPVPQGYDVGLAYDSKRDQVVLLAGGPSTSTTAVYSQRLWSVISTPVAPAYALAMTYDAAHGQTVALAPGTAAGTTETWLWDGASWTMSSAGATGPGLRTGAAIGCDPIRGQVVLFGGLLNANDQTQFFGDTWVWDGTSWHEVMPTRTPSLRADAAMVWNPARRALELIGGTSRGYVSLGDTWEWTGSGWTQLDVKVPARSATIAFPADDQEAVRVYGGSAETTFAYTPLEDMWELRLDDNELDERCEIAVDADGDGLAGCADPDCFATCDPTCLPGTSCTSPRPTCGDGMCESGFETCHSCPVDCTNCGLTACGDNFCDKPETTASCPGDCTP